MSFSNYEYNQLIKTIQIIGEFFKSSFGPKGMDKLLYEHFNNHLLISNDGTMILEDLQDLLEPTISKFILSWGKTLGKVNGDGIKRFYILLGAILEKMEILENEGIPKAIITRSLILISKKWIEFQNDTNNIPHCSSNYITDEKFLFSFFSSQIAGKLAFDNIHQICNVTIQIINQLQKKILLPWFDLKDYIQTEYIPGSLISDTQLLNGILVGKAPSNLTILPENGIKNARVLLIRQKLYLDLPDGGEHGPQGFQFDIKLKKTEDIANFEKVLKDYAKREFDKIKKFNPNIIITEKGISKQLEGLLERDGIITIRRAKPEQFKLLAQYLNAEIVENTNNISQNSIAHVAHVYRFKIGRDIQMIFKNSPKFGSIGTLVIGGSLWGICQEVNNYIQKLLLSAIALTHNPSYGYGGGNIELKFTQFLKSTIISRESLVKYALNSIADAFLIIPSILMENSGQDFLNGIAQMKSRYFNGNQSVGFDCISQSVCDMENSKIYDSFPSIDHIYSQLFEITLQISRIDRIMSIQRKVH